MNTAGRVAQPKYSVFEVERRWLVELAALERSALSEPITNLYLSEAEYCT